METVFHWLWGWLASPWTAARSTSADEVLRRNVDSEAATLRTPAAAADDVLRRNVEATDEVLRQY